MRQRPVASRVARHGPPVMIRRSEVPVLALSGCPVLVLPDERRKSCGSSSSNGRSCHLRATHDPKPVSWPRCASSTPSGYPDKPKRAGASSQRNTSPYRCRSTVFPHTIGTEGAGADRFVHRLLQTAGSDVNPYVSAVEASEVDRIYRDIDAVRCTYPGVSTRRRVEPDRRTHSPPVRFRYCKNWDMEPARWPRAPSVLPPLTSIPVPVIREASSERRKSTAAATSSGCEIPPRTEKEDM